MTEIWISAGSGFQPDRLPASQNRLSVMAEKVHRESSLDVARWAYPLLHSSVRLALRSLSPVAGVQKPAGLRSQSRPAPLVSPAAPVYLAAASVHVRLCRPLSAASVSRSVEMSLYLV
jgi:hypothetical protein